MAFSRGPVIVKEDLALYFDAANVKSFRGIPTSNIIAGAGLSTYNNVPGNVSSNLVSTSETYKGAVVWKQTLTALDSTGVSYLSNGNNPGIGVVIWGAGGGLANRYTGHSIFFKPTIGMHSPPIYTNYSNIPGWQSNQNYDDMGDGWFRAHVIWFDTVTRSDGKFWAINPLSAAINVPIDIYWAGPFKEDRNDSQVVSPFVNGTRGTTAATGGGILDISKVNGNNGELVNGIGFNSLNKGSLVFDGIDDYISNISNTGITHGNNHFSYFAWINLQGKPSLGTIFENGSWTPSFLIRFETDGITIYSMGSYYGKFSFNPPLNQWNYVGFIRVGNAINFYLNGVYQSALAFTANISPSSNIFIGTSQHATGQCFNGRIAIAQIYNRALTDSQVLQNYNAMKGRFV